MNRPLVAEHIEQKPLHEFTENAYLNYSMYVIMDRALPHIGDGLKPVQRRIVYAMSELGLKAAAKHKKSARTVGDVLGKFHPHGDSACYEAMVLMAQPFSYRYPLVDGQGNWGSQDDPKSFAAMRYTEARLSPYADVLLQEISQGTVDWVPNFDGTLDEPRLLPARLPNILLNGTSGIAVGMATDIPPHNMKEVIAACIHLLESPDATLSHVCKYIKAPDFPSNAEIITPKKDIQAMYKTGNGSVRARATYEIDGSDIVITSLPYQVSGEKILEQIAAQMQAKKLPMLEDLRDESDHEHPTRLVLIPRSSRTDVEAMMAHLFATTDLERSYRINMNVIGLDGKPSVKNLLTLLNEWLQFRRSTVTRRLEYRLTHVNARLHILDGLLIAFLNIDEVIHIIRTEDAPRQALMARFTLSEEQADAILDLKLRQIAKLEEIQIRAEQKALAEERDRLKKILHSPSELTALLITELKTLSDDIGDARRSPLIEREEAVALKEEEVISAEPTTVVLSEKGWIRAAKGHDIDPRELSYKAGDAFLSSAQGRSNQPVIVLDSSGRSYSFPAHQLPSARGLGDPVTGRVTPPAGAVFVGCLMGTMDSHCVLASDAGYGFVTTLDALLCKQNAGKVVLKPAENAFALRPVIVKNIETDFIAAVTSEGRLLVFPLRDLPILPRGKGNKIIDIPRISSEKREILLTQLVVLQPKQSLIVTSGKRSVTLTPSDVKRFMGERGRRGTLLPRGCQQVEALTVG